MKTSTFEKRASFLKKNTVVYRMISEAMHKDGIIRPCYTSGSGRYTHIADHKKQITDALNKMKIKFEVSNDSPRGGKCGDLIQLNKKQLCI